MKEPWQWDETDIQALIREQRKEDLSLEYKRSDALGKPDGKKAEIAKDVSAMANSAGGVIIYGVDEQKKSNGPIELDGGITPDETSIEWLQQVIDSGIQRRIDGIRVYSVTVTSTNKLVYVVWVPQSNRAPHMAAGHRYYKRLGTTTALMEEYEVRDVARRSESPDLYLDFKVRPTGTIGAVRLEPILSNHSAEPALYATCKLYIELGLRVQLNPNFRWSGLDEAELLWDNADRIGFQVFRHPWSVPERHPILEGDQQPMGPLEVNVGSDFARSPVIHMHKIGWEIRAPRALPKLQGLILTVDHMGPRLENRVAALSRL